MRSYWIYVILLLALAGSLVVYKVFFGKENEKKYLPGKSSNSLRQRFSIPVIEGNMVCNDSNELYYNRWYSPQEFPAGPEVVHAWKTVSTAVSKSIITSEDDAFRKRINDTLFYQLNINSVLLNDSSASKTGQVFFVLKKENESADKKFDKHIHNLNGPGIDSVFRSWQTH